jgi:hypothetical protein
MRDWWRQLDELAHQVAVSKKLRLELASLYAERFGEPPTTGIRMKLAKLALAGSKSTRTTTAARRPKSISAPRSVP